MGKDLNARKQELVRDAIYDAAMELFARKGFNETTVDEVVEAAGISQRSFFRYFPNKSDVLAYEIAGHGDALVAAVETAPRELPEIELVRTAAKAGVGYAMARPRTRQIIEITAQNFPARQAHRAAMVDVENRLSEAFAARLKASQKYSLEPRMLALLTQMAVDLTLTSWFIGESKDIDTAMRNVFSRLARLFGDRSGSSESSRRSRPAKPRSVGVATSR